MIVCSVELPGRRLRRFAVLLLVLVTAGVVAQEAPLPTPERFDVVGVGNVVWVDRTEPLVVDQSRSDDEFVSLVFHEVAEAAFYVAQLYEDTPMSHLFVLVDAQHGDFSSGTAAYFDSESFAAAFQRGSDGQWRPDLAAIATGAVIAPCLPEDLQSLRANRAAMLAMAADAEDDAAATDDEVQRVTIDAAQQLALHLVTIQVADSVEALNPPAYVLREDLGTYRVKRGDFWMRPLERRYSIERTAEVVWVDVNYPFDASVSSMPYFVSMGYAYAHMSLGEELAGSTVCVLAENGRALGYVSAVEWDRIAAAFSPNQGGGWEVNHTPILVRGSASPATADEIAEFRAIRDELLASEETPRNLSERLTRRVRSRGRGLWVSVAGGGGAYRFLPGLDFAMAEATVFRGGWAISVGAGYREMPFIIEAGDGYPEADGGIDWADTDITVTAQELALRFGIGIGTNNWRVDIGQTVIPIQLATDSTEPGVDTDEVIWKARTLKGISSALGAAGRIGPLYIGASIDWAQWLFADAPLLFNVYAGLSLKTGFRFHGGGFR